MKSFQLIQNRGFIPTLRTVVIFRLEGATSWEMIFQVSFPFIFEEGTKKEITGGCEK